MKKPVNIFRIISAAFLVAGTCIGGGMLGLPVKTSPAGFWPSQFFMAICATFMAISALLIAEVALWLEEGTHVMTMAYKLLGHTGRTIAGFIYMFIAYSALTAYTSAGNSIFHIFFKIWDIDISVWQGTLVFATIFGTVILLKSRIVGRINSFFMISLVISFIGLIILGIRGVSNNLLDRQNWPISIMSAPIILTSFSFQLIIPNLTSYLDRNPFAIRKAVILGVSIPFLAYSIWQWIILGSIPYDGPNGLEEALNSGVSVIRYLGFLISNNPYLPLIGQFFAFFALVTSYIGIGWGLFGFLADFLKLRKVGFRRLLLGILVALPPLLFAISFPSIFLIALGLNGGFGDSILHGIIPVLMVWTGRYIKKIKGPYQVSGGKITLLLILAFAILVSILQAMQL